jgi:chromosome segregation ATPase
MNAIKLSDQVKALEIQVEYLKMERECLKTKQLNLQNELNQSMDIEAKLRRDKNACDAAIKAQAEMLATRVKPSYTYYDPETKMKNEILEMANGKLEKDLAECKDVLQDLCDQVEIAEDDVDRQEMANGKLHKNIQECREEILMLVDRNTSLQNKVTAANADAARWQKMGTERAHAFNREYIKGRRLTRQLETAKAELENLTKFNPEPWMSWRFEDVIGAFKSYRAKDALRKIEEIK